MSSPPFSFGIKNMSKTISVGHVLERVNTQLASNEIPEQTKWGICSLIENILHDSGNYAGFNYIDGWNGIETPRRIYHPSKQIRDDYRKYEDIHQQKNGVR